MKVILVVLIIGLVLSKESLGVDKKRRGDESNRKIVDFLSAKKDKMEMFLSDMMG